MIHELKTWPEFYAAIESGAKTFELRRDDRGFAVGDTLRLREYAPGVGFTGRERSVRVTYMLRAADVSAVSNDALQDGYAILGFAADALDARQAPPPAEVTADPVRGFDDASKIAGWLRGYGFFVPDATIRTILISIRNDDARQAPAEPPANVIDGASWPCVHCHERTQQRVPMCEDCLEGWKGAADPPPDLQETIATLRVWLNRLSADQAMRFTTSDDERKLTSALDRALSLLRQRTAAPTGSEDQ